LLEIAEYYSQEVSAADSSDPVIFEVEIPEDSLLNDSAAMDEPVLVSEERRNEAWKNISEKHPEWIIG
jgi:hypothetical protein